MAETRRKLDPEHRSVDKLLFITGIVFLSLSVIFFVAMGTNSKDSYGYTSGDTIGYMVYAFICLIIGVVTLLAGCDAGCHCVKCCSNPSEDGLYCNGHDTGGSNGGTEYERHYHYDIHGHETGYTEVPKKQQ